MALDRSKVLEIYVALKLGEVGMEGVASRKLCELETVLSLRVTNPWAMTVVKI